MGRQEIGEFVLAGAVISAGAMIWRLVEWAFGSSRYYSECVVSFDIACPLARNMLIDRLLFNVAPFLALALLLLLGAKLLIVRPIMTDA